MNESFGQIKCHFILPVKIESRPAPEMFIRIFLAHHVPSVFVASLNFILHTQRIFQSSILREQSKTKVLYSSLIPQSVNLISTENIVKII